MVATTSQISPCSFYIILHELIVHHANSFPNLLQYPRHLWILSVYHIPLYTVFEPENKDIAREGTLLVLYRLHYVEDQTGHKKILIESLRSTGQLNY